MLDVLIRNGKVIDGSGNPSFFGDAGIRGDRIVDVGRLDGASAVRVIDAKGKIVSPGFIDTHSHSDSTVHLNPTMQSTIRQGITTEVVQNCGFGSIPVTARNREIVRRRLRSEGDPESVTWSSFGEYLDALSQMRMSGNLAHLVGHNTLRDAAGVSGAEVTTDQMSDMKRMLREAMESGALGMSTGLEFLPGRLANAEEIIELTKVAGEYGGYYASHIRNRDKYLQEAIEEFLLVVRECGVVGQVSHLNVRHNTGAPEGAWDRAVETLERAREEGLQVAADCTPLLDGGGLLEAILPSWVVDKGPAHTAELLRDPAVRARLRTDCDRYWAFLHRGDFHRVWIVRSDRHPEVMGKNLAEIGELWGKHAWDALFDLLASSFAGEDNVAYMGRLFTEEHVAAMVSCPIINLAVDDMTTAIDGPLAEHSLYPLAFCGMVHYLTFWVREKGVLRLEEAIRKMTSMGATQHGILDRGLLRTGFYADVVVFDYPRLDDVSTMEDPLAYPEGVEYVLVNGEIVVDGGEHTGARPGRSLLRA